MILMQGKGVSKGAVKGPVYFYQRGTVTTSHTDAADVEEEKRRLAEAKEKSILQHWLPRGCGGGSFQRQAGHRPVLVSSACPAEEEQFLAYQEVAASMDGKRACQKVMAELDADLSLLETFLAIGIDELSASPSAVLPLRAKIRSSIAQTCTLEKLEC